MHYTTSKNLNLTFLLHIKNLINKKCKVESMWPVDVATGIVTGMGVELLD